MKQKLLLTLSFIVLLLTVETAFTNQSAPPAGRTGAPGEATCNASGCHNSNSLVTNSSFLALSSVPSSLFTDGYTPGQTYNLIVNLSSSTPRYGFELGAFDLLNNNQAGSFNLTNTTTTSLLSLSSKQYVAHKNATSINAWSFQWTAPSAGTDTVVFYVVGNASNANGNALGDVIHSNSFKLHEAVAQPVTGCDEIFISEYVEGSGFNKAIELYNPTANPIDLSDYRMAQYNNGSASPGVYSTLSGVIQPYGTRVLVLDKRTGSPATDPDLAAKADTFMNPSNTAEVLYFNGDDAVVLEHLNGTVVDIIGVMGVDPGSAWGSGGNTTQNHTLVRKPTVTKGVTTNPASFDPADEWIAYPQDFFDSLGTHLSVCNPTFCSTLQLTATATNVSCNGGSDGSVALSVVGGTGVYTFSNNPVTNLTATTHTYIVTDDFGCADTTAVAVFEPLPLGVIMRSKNLSCGVSNDGEAYALPSGGTQPYTFAWSGGTPNGAGDTITGLTAGGYSVTLTDDNGCSTTGSVTITAPLQAQQPTAITGSASACSATTYAYSVPAQAGVTFTWAVSGGGTVTPNGNIASIEWTTAGSYTVSVTASTADCGSAPVQTLAVTVDQVPSAPIVAGAGTVCLPATETYTVSAVAGVTYNWTLSSGGTLTTSGNTVSVVWTTVGTHAISVTLSNQCGTSQAGSLQVLVGNPSVDLGNDTSACGQVGLSLSGFSSYQWSTGATTSQVNITQSATVGVTVTDNVGCTATDAVNVTVTPGPTLTLPATASDCDTAVVVAPNTFTTYAWSDGQTTATGSFTQSGTYTLTVTDAGGCSVSDDVTVTIFPVPDPSLPSTATDCDTVQVGGAGGFASYAWSNGETTQIATFTTSGFYSLTVTDNNGCVGSGTFEAILTGSAASADFTYTANGLDVDFTDASSGGNTYAWDFGDGTSSSSQNPSVTYAAEGSYVVSLTVSDNCGSDTFTDTVTVVSIGIADVAGINALEVYPNPTNSQLQVNWGAVNGTVTIEVWNTLGQRMQVVDTNAAIASQVLNVQELASGIYMLRIQVGVDSKLVKFVKE